ncbi:hypothetical protein J4442_03350 [Candidatus Woesearchaeota archaeon]|nr:hypothetical protein [Candidatus Woesearchaeota archaeon]
MTIKGVLDELEAYMDGGYTEVVGELWSEYSEFIARHIKPQMALEFYEFLEKYCMTKERDKFYDTIVRGDLPPSQHLIVRRYIGSDWEV